MKRLKNYLLMIFVLLFGLSILSAQEDVSYERFTSDDGRISFDAPEGWIITPFGAAFNVSTQGWVEAALIEPGQQLVDILLMNANDLEAAGASRDLAPEDYAQAVIASFGNDADNVTIEGTRIITLANGIDAGVIDITDGNARIFATIYHQDDVTVLVSATAHSSEFDAFEPIALHILNSIEFGDMPDDMTTMPEVPVVTVIANDDEIQLPPVPEGGVPAGLYTFQFINERTETEYSPVIGRFNDGVTMEEFNEALSVDDGLGAVFLVTLFGGTNIMPDDNVSISYYLEPGEYMLLEINEEGPGDMSPFTVVESGAELEEPQADVTLTMVDFAFGVPSEMPSGDLLWKFENTGEQWHEAAIYSVADGTTREDILASFEAGEEGDGGEFEQVFFWAPMSAGAEAWISIDLEPGTYAILCFLPDLTGDFSPHIAHGMVQVFTVE